MQAGIEYCLKIDEGERHTFLIQKLGLGRVKLHVFIACGNDAIESAELKALSFHCSHTSTKIKNQVITQSICDFHASLESISLSRSEDDMHLLIRKMILQKLLIIEGVSGASYHVDV
jgi:hypothetical protein